MTRHKNIPRTCLECGGEIRGKGTKYHLNCRIVVDIRRAMERNASKGYNVDATIGRHKAYERMILGHNL